MAYFEKDKNNKWLTIFYCKDHKGKNKQYKKRGFKTKKEAQEYAQNFISLNLGNENITLENLIVQFLKFKNNNKINTIKYYKLFSKKILEYFGSDFQVSKFNEKKSIDFLMLYNDRQTTQKYLKQFLKSLLNYACVYHNLKINPLDKIKLNTKKETLKKEILTIENFKKFDRYILENVKKSKLKTRAYFNLLFFSGARPGEIAGLTLKDIDFNNNTININKTRIKDNLSNTPKNKSSNRIVTIPKKTIDILKEYTDQVPNIQNMYIFSTTSFYKNFFIKYRKNNNIFNISLHSFRHSHASLLISKGLPITEISKRLGHANSQITLSVYAHLYDNTKDNAVKLLNDLLE